MKNIAINRVQYRVQSIPIYYRIIVVMWCSESGGEESGENECLLDEQHGRKGRCRRRDANSEGDVDGYVMVVCTDRQRKDWEQRQKYYEEF